MFSNDPRCSIALEFDRGPLLVRGIAPRDVPAVLANTLAWDLRVAAWRCDALEYVTVRRALIESFGPRVRDGVPPPARIHWPKSDLVDLRAEQRAAVEAWQSAGCRGVIVMPTGTGKTEVALAAMAAARVATLVVAPVRDLMHQWHQRILRRLGHDAGIVGDSLFNPQPITVTTYDSA